MEPRGKIIDEYYNLFFLAGQVYEDYAKAYQESSTSLFALFILYNHPDGLPFKTMKEQLLIPKQTLSSLLTSLKKRELVDDRPSVTDARSKEFFLTENGTRYCRKMLEKLKDLEKQSMEHLKTTDLHLMNKTNRSFLTTLGRQVREGA